MLFIIFPAYISHLLSQQSWLSFVSDQNSWHLTPPVLPFSMSPLTSSPWLSVAGLSLPEGERVLHRHHVRNDLSCSETPITTLRNRTQLSLSFSLSYRSEFPTSSTQTKLWRREFSPKQTLDLLIFTDNHTRYLWLSGSILSDPPFFPVPLLFQTRCP